MKIMTDHNKTFEMSQLDALAAFRLARETADRERFREVASRLTDAIHHLEYDAPRQPVSVDAIDDAQIEEIEWVLRAIDVLGCGTVNPGIMEMFNTLVEWISRQETMKVVVAGTNVGFDLSNIMDDPFETDDN